VLTAKDLRARAGRWLAGTTDETVLRWLFRAILAATVTMVALDYHDLAGAMDDRERLASPFEQPALTAPAIKRQRGTRHAAPSHELEARLRAAMTFDLVDGGRLLATGTITPGTARDFAAEVDKRGGYINTVLLQSPGGSVQDAMTMGRLIRKNNFATEVGKGAHCASSCPLVFAGGVERRAGRKAAIGVHQVFAANDPVFSQDDGMASAQHISATAQRYLRDMGIDLAVWMRAMETPKDELYFFSPAELLELKLATEAAGAKTDRAGTKTRPAS
jgi:hypothetical protein